MTKHIIDQNDERILIVSAIQRISKKLLKTPTQLEYKIHRANNELSLEQITYRFGRYSAAVKEAGLTPNDFQKPPKQREIEKSELINEFIRIAQIEAKVPSKDFFRANSLYSWTPYKTKWGSWKNAVDYITTNYQKELGFVHIKLEDKIRLKKRKELKRNCALVFEPSNEMEAIVLFGILADSLGYKILKVQTDFPDGIIEKDGLQIPVEFEFLSSNYLQHGHPLDFDGLCICWRNDCSLGKIKIFSLEEYIRTVT